MDDINSFPWIKAFRTDNIECFDRYICNELRDILHKRAILQLFPLQLLVDCHLLGLFAQGNNSAPIAIFLIEYAISNFAVDDIRIRRFEIWKIVHEIKLRNDTEIMDVSEDINDLNNIISFPKISILQSPCLYYQQSLKNLST